MQLLESKSVGIALWYKSYLDLTFLLFIYPYRVREVYITAFKTSPNW